MDPKRRRIFHNASSTNTVVPANLRLRNRMLIPSVQTSRNTITYQAHSAPDSIRALPTSVLCGTRYPRRPHLSHHRYSRSRIYLWKSNLLDWRENSPVASLLPIAIDVVVIKRIVKRSEKLPEEARRKWASKRRSIFRVALDDLLELSRRCITYIVK